MQRQVQETADVGDRAGVVGRVCQAGIIVTRESWQRHTKRLLVETGIEGTWLVGRINRRIEARSGNIGKISRGSSVGQCFRKWEHEDGE